MGCWSDTREAVAAKMDGRMADLTPSSEGSQSLVTDEGVCVLKGAVISLAESVKGVDIS
jgi:hypothetical protein